MRFAITASPLLFVPALLAAVAEELLPAKRHKLNQFFPALTADMPSLLQREDNDDGFSRMQDS